MKLRIVLLAMLTMFAVSCQEEQIAVNDLPEGAELSITEVLESYGNSENDSDASRSKGSSKPTFNTVEKIVELYERLVQAEKDKVEYLEKLLNGK